MASMTADFAPFEKMATSSHKFPKAPKGQFVATEKVHGANFSIIVCGRRSDENVSIKYAKRSGVIAHDEDFFGFRTCGLPERYEACARQVHANVCALSSLGGVDSSADDIVRVNIFGELFGGAYPGRRSKVAPVQIGVYYTSEIEFMPFDVAVQVLNTSDDGDDRIERLHVYLDYEVARSVCRGGGGEGEGEGEGFLFAPPLFTGTFEECMAVPHEFDSTLPSLFGMPPLNQPHTNLAEGLVVKACREVGSRAEKRLILKRKIEAFTENASKYNQAKPRPAARGGGSGAGGAGGAGGGVSGTELLYYELVAGVTEPRVQSVLSKDSYDLSDSHDAKRLLRALVADIIADLGDDDRAVLEQLGDDDRKALLARVRDPAKECIAAHATKRAKEIREMQTKSPPLVGKATTNERAAEATTDERAAEAADADASPAGGAGVWTLDEFLAERELPAGSTVAVLTLLGSLCPITRGHVVAFEQARAMLLGEQTGAKRPTKLEAFGAVVGLISLNGSGYVERKLRRKGEAALAGSERRMLVQMAITDHPWLTLEEAEGASIEQLRSRWPALQFEHFVLNGADDVLRHSKYTWCARGDAGGSAKGKRRGGGRMICLGRPGFTEAVMKEAADEGVDFDAGDFILGPELPDLSSTDARRALAKGDAKRASAILDPRVAAWCVEQGPWRPAGASYSS